MSVCVCVCCYARSDMNLIIGVNYGKGYTMRLGDIKRKPLPKLVISQPLSFVQPATRCRVLSLPFLKVTKFCESPCSPQPSRCDSSCVCPRWPSLPPWSRWFGLMHGIAVSPWPIRCTSCAKANTSHTWNDPVHHVSTYITNKLNKEPFL